MEVVKSQQEILKITKLIVQTQRIQNRGPWNQENGLENLRLFIVPKGCFAFNFSLALLCFRLVMFPILAPANKN